MEGSQPTERNASTARRRGPKMWYRYVLELLVIIVGIMVSFLLNEWRQSIRDRDKEQRLLHDLHADLRQDSIAIQDELADLERIMHSSQRLHAHPVRNVPLDSVVAVLGPVLSYSIIPFHQVTYREMLATGDAELLRDDQLLRDIMELYERHYFMIRELGEIDERIVLDRMFPVSNRTVLFEQPDTASMNTLMRDVEWRNLLNLSMFFKSRIIEDLKEQLDRIDRIMRRIEKEMEE